MIKSLAFAGLALSSSIAYAVCPEGNTTTLCFDPVDSNLSKILTQKEQVINMNGDGVLDKVYVDETTKEVAIKLGKACSAGSDDICFDQPFYTGILNNKGFLADDLTGNGIPELTVRTDQDVIKVYNQPGFGQGKDDGYRIGDPEYISILGTNGLTEASYSASTVEPIPSAFGLNHDSTIAGAFDGYLQNVYYPGQSNRFNQISPLATTPIGRNSHWYSDPAQNYPGGGEWLQVEFNTPVSVSSFEVYNIGGGLETTPRTNILKYSNDGINFDTHYGVRSLYGTILLPNLNNPYRYISDMPKPTPFAKIFRLYISDEKPGGAIHPYNKANGLGTKVSELMFKGWVKPAE